MTRTRTVYTHAHNNKHQLTNGFRATNFHGAARGHVVQHRQRIGGGESVAAHQIGGGDAEVNLSSSSVHAYDAGKWPHRTAPQTRIVYCTAATTSELTSDAIELPPSIDAAAATPPLDDEKPTAPCEKQHGGKHGAAQVRGEQAVYGSSVMRVLCKSASRSPPTSTHNFNKDEARQGDTPYPRW